MGMYGNVYGNVWECIENVWDTILHWIFQDDADIIFKFYVQQS